jgi:hypothetical protein
VSDHKNETEDNLPSDDELESFIEDDLFDLDSETDSEGWNVEEVDDEDNTPEATDDTSTDIDLEEADLELEAILAQKAEDEPAQTQDDAQMKPDTRLETDDEFLNSLFSDTEESMMGINESQADQEIQNAELSRPNIEVEEDDFPDLSSLDIEDGSTLGEESSNEDADSSTKPRLFAAASAKKAKKQKKPRSKNVDSKRKSAKASKLLKIILILVVIGSGIKLGLMFAKTRIEKEPAPVSISTVKPLTSEYFEKATSSPTEVKKMHPENTEAVQKASEVTAAAKSVAETRSVPSIHAEEASSSTVILENLDDENFEMIPVDEIEVFQQAFSQTTKNSNTRAESTQPFLPVPNNPELKVILPKNVNHPALEETKLPEVHLVTTAEAISEKARQVSDEIYQQTKSQIEETPEAEMQSRIKDVSSQIEDKLFENGEMIEAFKIYKAETAEAEQKVMPKPQSVEKITAVVEQKPEASEINVAKQQQQQQQQQSIPEVSASAITSTQEVINKPLSISNTKNLGTIRVNGKTIQLNQVGENIYEQAL